MNRWIFWGLYIISCLLLLDMIKNLIKEESIIRFLVDLILIIPIAKILEKHQ